MNINLLESRIEKQVNNYFKSQGYTDDEAKELGLFNIQFKENKLDDYVDVYLYAEISIEEFSHLVDKLDDVVEKFDPSAYFDINTPGVYMARIYNVKSDRIDDVDISKKYLKEFGQYVVDELNDYLHFREVSLESCKIEDRNILTTKVKVDGRSVVSSRVKLDPNRTYTYGDLTRDYLNIVYEEILDKILV